MVHVASGQHLVNCVLVDSTRIVEGLKELVEEPYKLAFVKSTGAVLVVIAEDLVDVEL
jgi:hypothetical protein